MLFLSDHWNAQYLKVIQEHAAQIELVISAHTHSNEFKLFPGQASASGQQPSDMIPGPLIPSISPLHLNNPAYAVYSVDADKRTVNEMSVYSLQLAAKKRARKSWKKEYDFTRAYGGRHYSSEGFQSLFLSMQAASSPERSDYVRFFNSESPSSAGLDPWEEYGCSIPNLDQGSFAHCYCGTH